MPSASGARRDGDQMAAQYNLQPNEVVILKTDAIMHGGGFGSAYTDELILTNLNLVLVRKGVFGNSKGVLTFPVSQIKVHNQQAQVAVGKNRGADALEVYFVNGHEYFNFGSGRKYKKKVHEWVAKINFVVTGQDAPVQSVSSLALPGAELVAGVLKDTFGVFKSKLGSQPGAPVTISGKCRSCGAPATGFQGQTITCEYCGSAQPL